MDEMDIDLPQPEPEPLNTDNLQLLCDAALELSSRNGTTSVASSTSNSERDDECFTLTLMDHQKEWLTWAMNQESSKYKGGILADEMGLGKTIQVIALVLKKLDRLSPSTSKRARMEKVKSTLVVCPMVSLKQWKEEILRCAPPGGIRVLICNNRKTNCNFGEYDFVLTTYSLVRAQHGQAKHLHSVKWNRIVLDEAHKIIDRDTMVAQAIFALKSTYKWAVTGTPMLQSIKDLYSLIHFLRVDPYSYVFCGHMGCECRYFNRRPRRLNHTCSCNHKNHYDWFDKYVIRKKDESMTQQMLAETVLRRTKMEILDGFLLPPRKLKLRLDPLDEEEKILYNTLYQGLRQKFAFGRINYNAEFEFIIKLRQALCHPQLLLPPRTIAIPDISNRVWEVCGACGAVPENRTVTPCGHVFCEVCLIVDYRALEVCPYCLNNFDFEAVMHEKGNIVLYNGDVINLSNFQTSTKLEALKEEIQWMFERDASAKGVVFSQFVPFLKLIKKVLHEGGVKCTILEGGAVATRNIIDEFNDDPECRILLTTLKTGGLSLNLQAGSYVFMMEPCWDLAQEEQAYARIHRIGQYKPVNIVKFAIMNTVEERVLEVQEEKDVFLRTSDVSERFTFYRMKRLFK